MKLNVKKSQNYQITTLICEDPRMLASLYTAVWPKPVNCSTILQNFKTYETTGRIVTFNKIPKKIRLHSTLQFINFGLKS